MFNEIINKHKILLVIDIFLIIVSIIGCKYIFGLELQKTVFINQLEQFSKENKNPVFRVGQIILYSSANAIDNSDGRLENVSISQFTDIAIYIDNKNKNPKLTAENTIKELYIDNIKVKVNSEDGEHIFNYKNPKEFGKYVSLKNYDNDKILMNVISTNEQINKADYNKNIFYTDCTNPISLGFVNRNFIKNGKVTDAQGLLLFDGSILKNANVDLKTISGKIDFLIHIKNNLGENFICNVSIENDLTKNEEEILNGYSMKILDLKDKKYDFLKVSN